MKFENNLNAFGLKYKKPRFPTSLKKSVNENQKYLLNFFENFNYLNKNESFKFGKNTPCSIIKLTQKDFDLGTVRITKPGVYVLNENIVFNPNEENDFFPTHEQVKSNLYPIGRDGPYHLGFFAAITIETENVILDLNGHTIKQSILHNLQQRFYSHIELANSPFIPKQGPGSFIASDTFVFAENVLIKNGILAKSSHHGIHGNSMKNIILDNIEITDFEVAGIALNGTKNGIITDINIHDSSKKVPVLSTYSAARFIRNFLPSVKKNHKNPFITIQGEKIYYDDIVKNLNAVLEETKNHVLEKNNNLIDNLFLNDNNMSDGNVYGLLLHVNGVAVNGFNTIRNNNMIGNENIFLQNISISNISSHPIEIIGINNKTKINGNYGKNMQVGSAGEVIRINDIFSKNGMYIPNQLSNAQMLIGKYNTPKIGTTNISSEIIDVVERNQNFNNLIKENVFYYIDGADSMAHVMKGNMGLFVSCGINIIGNNILIKNIRNETTNVGLSPLINENQKTQGSTSNGILISGSEKIYFIKCCIDNIYSNLGNKGVHEIYNINSFDISINDNYISVNK